MNGNKITITKAETKITRALDRLIEDFPCFTSVRAQWTVREDNKITDTMTTNGGELFWNRSFVDWMTNEEAAWVVLHEAAHVFLGHHFRCLGADKEIRNQAFDLAANWLIQGRCPDRLRALGCFPGMGSFAELPINKDAEFYLKELQKSQQEQDKSEDKSEDKSDAGEQGEGDQLDDKDGYPGESGESTESDPDQKDDGSSSSPDQSGGESNPGSEQGENKGEKTFDPATAGEGDVGEVLEVKPEEVQQAEQTWEEIVSEGILAAEMAGNSPGWAKQMQQALASKNRVQWFHHLKNLMQELGDDGQSYSRANRKSSWRSDVIMPSNVDRNNGKGVVLVDTSGSMSAKEMDSTLARIEEIVREFAGAEISLIQCDTRIVGEEKKFTAADFPIKVPTEWYGRGGTDLNPALTQIGYQAGAKEWAWVIVISDMYLPMTAVVNPGVPCFWVKTAQHDWRYGKPNFGTCLEAVE